MQNMGFFCYFLSGLKLLVWAVLIIIFLLLETFGFVLTKQQQQQKFPLTSGKVWNKVWSSEFLDEYNYKEPYKEKVIPIHAVQVNVCQRTGKPAAEEEEKSELTEHEVTVCGCSDGDC